MGVVLKRAVYFITCEGRQMYPLRMDEDFILHNLLSSERNERGTAGVSYRQLSLFDDQAFSPEEAGISAAFRLSLASGIQWKQIWMGPAAGINGNRYR